MIFRELISGGGAFGADDYFSGCGEVLTKILVGLTNSRQKFLLECCVSFSKCRSSYLLSINLRGIT
jgi:hypothetical protein